MKKPKQNKGLQAASVADFDPRKQAIRTFFDGLAEERDDWVRRNEFFYAADRDYMRFLIPQGAHVLELGCGTGQLLASLDPARGIGLDISEGMIDIARSKYPNLKFHVGDMEDSSVIASLKGPFDAIVLTDTIGMLGDIESTLRLLRHLCTPETRIIIAYYSQLWNWPLSVAGKLGNKMPQVAQSWLSPTDIAQLLSLADFDVVKFDWRQIVPKRLFGAGTFLNRYVGSLPGIRHLSLRNYVVARMQPSKPKAPKSVTVLIPCRNERGNIEPAIKRIPDFCPDIEVLFVEGHSQDGTLDEINRVIEAYPDRDIKGMVQPGKGKGDAVRAGFDAARGEVLMILDADLTVPPETLPNFFNAIASGKGEFVNGTRLIYPMEKRAMRFLNKIANRSFSAIFSWLISQRLTDTLCGTKVLSKRHYEMIAANRSYFGDFDPFGDFDLIFGASKLNLKIIEVPIRYADRAYGSTQISRFRDGWQLIKMVVFAFRKLKAF
ncbi:MAG: glycosyltransferase [Rhodospirillales bacterium]|jgi:SAM-dependent methyltransferase|nr:glycosyltransferase [Rhodospirillales bacterium]